MAEDASSENEPIAGLSNDDITPHVYEGGFKTWECSVDLATYLASDIPEQEFEGQGHGWNIIEVGLIRLFYRIALTRLIAWSRLSFAQPFALRFTPVTTQSKASKLSIDESDRCRLQPFCSDFVHCTELPPHMGGSPLLAWVGVNRRS